MAAGGHEHVSCLWMQFPERCKKLEFRQGKLPILKPIQKFHITIRRVITELESVPFHYMKAPALHLESLRVKKLSRTSAAEIACHFCRVCWKCTEMSSKVYCEATSMIPSSYQVWTNGMNNVPHLLPKNLIYRKRFWTQDIGRFCHRRRNV